MKIAMVVAACAAFASNAAAQKLSGLWDGNITYENVPVAFQIEFASTGGDLKGSFFNGDERVTSTSGRVSGNSVLLTFAHYATTLDAKLEDGVLRGTYGSKRNGFHVFEARPHLADAPVAVGAPEIGGVWNIPNESPKGEHAWRFIVRQSGGKVSAAILRVDGDTGLLSGAYQGDGRFLLSHFDGARAGQLEIVQLENGTLALTLRGGRGGEKSYTAIREPEARAKGLAQPADFTAHTSVKDPSEPFAFRFPDLKGNLVSNTDTKFRDKVVLVNITGSWCPNCHDEAPFLEALYKRYRALGLEIVALDFEEAEQLKDPTRLPAFIKEYGIEYTYLVAGEPSQLTEKIPQAVNLNSWPTTFILGRDGRVREVHAGFAAKASGAFHEQLKAEFAGTIEKLLAENVRAER